MGKLYHKTDRVQRVTVEGKSLDACLAKLTERLHADVETIRYEVLQEGRSGWLGSTPYRLAGWVERHAGSDESPRSGLMEDLDIDLFVLEEHSKAIGFNQPGTDPDRFIDQMLKKFESLGEDLQQDLLGLDDLLSENSADRLTNAVHAPGDVDVAISEDRLTVTMRVFPPRHGGSPADLKLAYNKLVQAGVRFGVKAHAVKKALARCAELGDMVETVVAHGCRAENGADGHLVPHVDVPVCGVPDSVDFTDAPIVSEGALLFGIAPPTEGMAGRDVLGHDLPARNGMPVAFDLGDNVVYDEQTDTLRSTCEGLLIYDGRTVSVKTLYVIKGDLDIEVGNVDFRGSVLVRGSVRAGMTLKARDDITIEGLVEQATVVSETGSVRIREGIAGGDRAHVSAAKDVECTYAEQATVYAGDTIRIRSASLHSRLMAGRTIEAITKRGTLAGGTLRAGQRIEAKTIGAVNEPHTVIEMGVSLETQKQIEKLDREVAAIKATVDKMNATFDHAMSAIGDLTRANPKQKRQLTELKKRIVVLKYLLTRSDELKTRILSEAMPDSGGVVIAHGVMFPNCKVQMGRARFACTQERRHCLLRYDSHSRQVVLDQSGRGTDR